MLITWGSFKSAGECTEKIDFYPARNICLTLISVDFSGACFKVVEEGKITLPPPKLVRIMLETSNLVRKYTHKSSFRKYTFRCQDPLDFADVSISFAEDQHFLAKIVPLLKAIVWELCWRFFSSAFSFYNIKGYF